MDLSKERVGLEKRFYDLILPVVERLGLQLYELEYLSGGSLLRIFIQNPMTKSADINECAQVDRELSEHFEAEWVPENIILEVSSPGIFRELTSTKHFVDSLKKRVQVALKRSVFDIVGESANSLSKASKASRKFVSELHSVTELGIEVLIEGEKQIINIPFVEIKNVNLEPKI